MHAHNNSVKRVLSTPTMRSPNNKVTVFEDSNDAQKRKENQHRFVRRQLISATVTTQDTDYAYCIDSLYNIKKSIITNVAKEVNVSLNFSVPTEIDTKVSAIKNILLRDNSATFFDVF